MDRVETAGSAGVSRWNDHARRYCQIGAVSAADGVCGLQRPLDHDHFKPGLADAGGRIFPAGPDHRHESRCVVLSHVAAAAVGAGRSPSSSLRAAGSAAAMPNLRPRPRSGSGSTICFAYLVYASLFGGLLTLLLLQLRTMPLPSLLAGQAMGGAAASAGFRHSLWHRARGSRAHHLSGHDLDESRRKLIPRRCKSFQSVYVLRGAIATAYACAPCRSAALRARNQLLTRFRYRSLTML